MPNNKTRLSLFNRFILEIQEQHAQTISAIKGRDCAPELETIYRADPTIDRQLEDLPPADLAAELKGYGAWTPEELQDREQNKRRTFWLACIGEPDTDDDE
jgi:hypothetical protein